MNCKAIVLIALVLGYVGSLPAAGLKYLPADHVHAQSILPPPPPSGTSEDLADLDTVARVHAAASAADLATAADEVKLTIFHFAPAIGPWFVRGKFPKTEALFAEVETEAKAVTNEGKAHWRRIRPYHVDPVRVPHAVENEKKTDYSYPSGHSTRGTVYSLLLAELFPEKRDALLGIGREIGWLRVEGGVHYPSDVLAGRVLGIALAKDFLRDPDFGRDLAAAREELAATVK